MNSATEAADVATQDARRVGAALARQGGRRRAAALVVGGLAMVSCSSSHPTSAGDGGSSSDATAESSIAPSSRLPDAGAATPDSADGSRGGQDGASSGASSPGEGGATNPTDASPAPACTPSCLDKSCGSDGCGSTCGGCPPTQMCGPGGTCEARNGSGIVVDVASQRTPISPDIYGIAFGADTGDDSYKVSTLDRWGGDAETSYNWQKDLHNSGADYMCASYAGSGHDSDTFVQTNEGRNLDTLMTIPITGWIANVATSTDSTFSPELGQDLSFCNYPLLADGGLLPSSECCKAIGTQESTLVDRGSATLDTSFMGAWVSHLVSTFGPAASGGVKYYQLDNEPDNWQGLRQDVYAALYPPGTNCLDYSLAITSGPESGVSPDDDIIDRSVAYAAAVKNADPTAQVLFLSVMNPNDAVNLLYTECGVGQSWGSQFAVPYTATSSYAMAMMAKGKQYEEAHHRRIFDCLDTHYPGDAQSMWTNTFSRFQGWVDSTYPGTGLCVSEYNVANDTSDPTATAKEADYLGTFGVMGVRVAAYWTTLAPKNSNNDYVHSYAYNAFAMFRDYDGAGGAFGSVAVGAQSSYAGLHAYAATDSASAPTRLWVMLVNTAASAQTGVSISIQNFVPAASAKMYASTDGAAPAAAGDVTVSNGTISGLSVAANSVVLIAAAQ